nr:endocuticle structural glycoprotein SgAbd-9-like [Drosophila takahashii]
MASAKLVVFSGLLAVMAANCLAGLLDDVIPTIITEFYSQAPTKEGYRFNSEDPNGSKREEVGMILNPGTEKEEVVVMGSYSTYDEKSDTDTVTMYTADKNGYKARYQIKNRKLSPGALKSAAG